MQGQLRHSIVVSSDRATGPVQHASLLTMAGQPGAPSCLQMLSFNHKSPKFPISLREKLVWVYKIVWKPVKKDFLKTAYFHPLMTKQADMT